ncbi:MAG: hypothetical protein A2X03_04060 [Bacteroidetes bacterium GWA2_40_15]|nr:MAG: hypothetical protein A2X03_04060 [Bacteroidetes bacterium GWA2_40_15]OFX97244.1 MAG: hypothetical protein A2X06_06645 [Bacteroidetes bacterium GWC2_40_22]HBH85087.1 energy transducer TonB [Bacteroidales bacterium]HBQ83643.1 energy transducer TonB [Bacteroidales bacterium]
MKNFKIFLKVVLIIILVNCLSMRVIGQTGVNLKDLLTPQNQTSQDSVYMRADEFPEFPGGIPAMREFYQKNIKYPEECMESGTEGKLAILIIIEKDGSVTVQKVLKSAHPLLVNELIRVIKICPKYKPAKINGNPVRFNMVIPYEFKL